MGLVYYCQDVVYPDSAWRAVRKTKSFGGLVRSRLRWNSLMRELTPAFKWSVVRGESEPPPRFYPNR